MTSVEIGLLISLGANSIALWAAWSAWKQRQMAAYGMTIAARQVSVTEEANKLQEIQILYAAKYQALETRFTDMEQEARTFRAHAKWCEDELAQMHRILGTMESPGTRGT